MKEWEATIRTIESWPVRKGTIEWINIIVKCHHKRGLLIDKGKNTAGKIVMIELIFKT